MANITITSIVDKDGDMERVIIHGRHSCDLKLGQMDSAQFHLAGTHTGWEPEGCGCHYVVPPGIWKQVTAKYRLMQRLEGR